jgi:hypothetical protein
MKQSLRDLSAAASDQFSYLIVYAPNFPADDQTTADLECERLLGMLREVAGRAASTPKKQWLELAIIEVEQARMALRANQASAANDLFHSAEDHFKAYLSGKQAKATFVVGPDGGVEPA